MVVGAFQDDTVNSITPTLISTMIETTGGKSVMMDPNGSNIRTITMTWSAKKRFGGSVLSNNDLKATKNSIPTLIPTFTLVMQDLAKTTARVLNYSVEIEYIAVWKNLRDIAGS